MIHHDTEKTHVPLEKDRGGTEEYALPSPKVAPLSKTTRVLSLADRHLVEEYEQRAVFSNQARDGGLEHYGWRIVLGFTVCFAFFLLGMTALGAVPGKSFLLKSCSDILQFVGEAIGLSFCLYSTLRLRNDALRLDKEQKQRKAKNQNPDEIAALHAEVQSARRAWIAWGLLALGIALYACGQATWTCYDVRMPSSSVPFPGLYDYCFVASYPSFWIGTLLLIRRKMIIGQVRLTLDALAVLGAAFALSWFFVLGPTIAALYGNWGAEFLSLYFPTSDLFLMAVSALLMFSPLSTRYLQPVFLRLCTGLIILAVTDSLLGYFSLSPSGFNTGTLQDTLWPLSMMFIGLAAIEYPRCIAREKQLVREGRTPTLSNVSTSGRLMEIGTAVRTIIPFLLALLTSIVLLISVHFRGGAVLLQADLVALALVVIVVIRQALTLIENTQLTMQIQGELELSQDELQAKRLQALTDALTGLPNHRAVMDQLSRELERTRRSHRAFSVLFFDADRFKQVNDTYGHAAGDAVLRQIGERVGGVLRNGDILGRFGGEEFVVLLPEADKNEASNVAERMRAAVAARPLATAEVNGGILMTVSIGIATYPTDADTEQELLQQADDAMYLAKRLGRNQVRTALEARQAGVDVELIVLLQKEEHYEAMQQEGITVERLRETYTVKMICSLLALLERRDERLSAHVHAVSDLATAIAREMQQDSKEVARIGRAALLHDIGKVALPDQLLQKTGPLSSQERTRRWEHTELGAQILEASPFLIDLVPMVRSHHERWDGHGYPDQLAGEEIPLAARIIAVAEAYDAMQRTYPYQAGCSEQEALTEVQRCAGTQFDPAVVRALAAILAVSQQPEQSLQTVV